MNLVSEARKFCKSHVEILSLSFRLILVHIYPLLAMRHSLICGSFTSLDERLGLLVRLWAPVEILVVKVVIICHAESYVFIRSPKLTQSHGIIGGRINWRLGKILLLERLCQSIFAHDLVLPILLHRRVHDALHWVALRMDIRIALSRIQISACSLFKQLFMKNVVMIISSRQNKIICIFWLVIKVHTDFTHVCSLSHRLRCLRSVLFVPNHVSSFEGLVRLSNTFIQFHVPNHLYICNWNGIFFFSDSWIFDVLDIILVVLLKVVAKMALFFKSAQFKFC